MSQDNKRIRDAEKRRKDRRRKEKEDLIRLSGKPKPKKAGTFSKDTHGSRYDRTGVKYAVNSSLAKFGMSETQAALCAWSHTVANPRTLNPHPVPVAASPGSSSAEARMFQCTLYGTAVANTVGAIHIGANVDGWWADNAQMVPQPDSANIYLGYSAQGKPVVCTQATYVGGATVGATGLSFPGSSDTGAHLGIQTFGLPANFIPSLTVAPLNSRFTCVSVELRAKPVSVPLETSGMLCAFTPKSLTTVSLPVNYAGPNDAYGEMLDQPFSAVARHEESCANWDSDKWLSVVAIPNTYTCFGQWPPANAGSITVGQCQLSIIGKALTPGQEVVFEVTYNYAVYGTTDFQIGSQSGSQIAVDPGRMDGVVANGMQKLVKPGLNHANKVDPAGVASVIKAEDADGRIPKTSPSVTAADAIKFVKGGKDVIEATTGIDIAEEIMEVVGTIGAMFL